MLFSRFNHLMTGTTITYKVAELISFFFSSYSKFSKRFYVVNIESFFVFFRGFSTTPTNSISESGKSSLASPRFAIILFISTLPSWVQISTDIFRTPFSITLSIAKHILWFSITIMYLFSCNWLSTIRTWWTAFSPLFYNIFPSKFSPAFSRTGSYIKNKRWSVSKSFITDNTFSFFCFTFIAIKRACSRSKDIPTFFTSSISNHFSLLFEKISCILRWGIHTGMDLSMVHDTILAPSIIA